MSQTDRARAMLPDLQTTVLRLIEEVGKLTEPRTDEHIDAALRDLAHIRPWRGSPPGTLARDFCAVIEQAPQRLKSNVRLTLGLDFPSESLTARRSRQQGRPPTAGGSTRLRIDSYELSQILFAMALSRPAPAGATQGALGGFVVQEVELSLVLGACTTDYWITLICECERDGERALVIPTPPGLGGPGVATINTDNNVEKRRSQGGIQVDPAAAEYGYYHVVPLELPAIAGEAAVVSFTNTDRGVQPHDQRPLTDEVLSWRTLGTEHRITLRLVAPLFVISDLYAWNRSPHSATPRRILVPALKPSKLDDGAPDYPLTAWTQVWEFSPDSRLTARVLDLRWSLRAEGLTKREKIVQNRQLPAVD